MAPLWHLAALLRGDARPKWLAAYALALGGCIVAMAVSFLAVPVYADDSIAALLFLAAVGVAGWYGGLGPALLATVIGVLIIDYFFETPGGTLQITNAH